MRSAVNSVNLRCRFHSDLVLLPRQPCSVRQCQAAYQTQAQNWPDRPTGRENPRCCAFIAANTSPTEALFPRGRLHHWLPEPRFALLSDGRHHFVRWPCRPLNGRMNFRSRSMTFCMKWRPTTAINWWISWRAQEEFDALGGYTIQSRPRQFWKVWVSIPTTCTSPCACSRVVGACG